MDPLGIRRVRPAGRGLVALAAIVLFVPPAASAATHPGIRLSGAPAGLLETTDGAVVTAPGTLRPASVVPAYGAASCMNPVDAHDGGVSQNCRAPSTRYSYGRSVYLLGAFELELAHIVPGQQVTVIAWQYDTPGNVGGSAPLKVYLENTGDFSMSKSTNWATAITGMTLVHDAVTAFPAGAPVVQVPFTGGTAFTYTGGALYVAFDWGPYPGPYSPGVIVQCNVQMSGGLLGGQSQSVPPVTLTASNFRPATQLDSQLADDLAVQTVSLPGSVPLGLAPPVVVHATIANRGANDRTNVPVTLTVTGTTTFTDTRIVPAIAACTGTASVAFAPFTPGALGSSTVTVSVPADDVAGDDELAHAFEVTLPIYSYQYPGEPSGAGFGFDAGGAMACRFHATQGARVTHVLAEFTQPALAYRVALYAVAGDGSPGDVLYVDAADRQSGTGPHTIELASPVDVPGDFYAAVLQTTAADFLYLGIDFEAPVRAPSTFFYSLTWPPAQWTDFAPNLTLKPNIGVVLDRCDPTLAASNDGPVCPGATLHLTSTAAAAVTWEWTGPNDFHASVQNPRIENFTSAYAGTYTVRVNGCATGVTTDVAIATERTITASAGPDGSISPAGAVTVACGGDAAFTITPDAGFAVDDVLVDGVSVGAVTAYTFPSVLSDHAIAASFTTSTAVRNGTSAELSLASPQPNPFGRGTRIGFSLPSRAHVALRVYDLTGRVVRELVAGERGAGAHTVEWDGRDARGDAAREGTYFVRLVVDGRTVGARRAVLLGR